MNPLRPPSSSFKQRKAGRGRGAPAALTARSIAAAPAAPADGSSSAIGAPSALAAETSPTLESLRAAGFPEWWKSSSPLGSSAGIYPQGGFTNLLKSNATPENFHLVGITRTSTTISPNAPSLKRTLPAVSNAQDKETIDADVDETNEDERTERRLNWTKDEDVRLVAAWLLHSKDPVEEPIGMEINIGLM